MEKQVGQRIEFWHRLYDRTWGITWRYEIGTDRIIADYTDRMTPAAQLALLSKLDATAFPPNTVFIFTCNSTDGLEPRFLSRCRVIEFSSYGMANEIASYLDTIWHAEGGNGNAPDLNPRHRGSADAEETA